LQDLALDGRNELKLIFKK